MLKYFFIFSLIPTTCYSDSFSGLGDIEGGKFYSEALAISTDGSVIAGLGSNPETLSIKNLVIWKDKKLIDLGALEGKYDAYATSISSDGGIVGGISGNEGFIWSQKAGFKSVGKGKVTSVSPDGKYVAGEANYQAAIWEVDSGKNVSDLLPKKHMFSKADCISNRANFVCISASQKAYLKNGSSYKKVLDNGLFLDISNNSKYLVGFNRNRKKRGFPTEGVFWSSETGVVYLPGIKKRLPVITYARAVSENGEIVVGETSRIANSNYSISTPFVWLRNTGEMINLESYLRNKRIIPAGWLLYGATDISGDGKVVIGSGRNPQGHTEAWVATIESIQNTVSP